MVKPINETTRYVVRDLPKNIHRELKALAAFKGETLNELILSILEEGVKKESSAVGFQFPQGK